MVKFFEERVPYREGKKCKHQATNAKTHCNISGLHLNSKGVALFNENFTSLSNTLDSKNRHKDQKSEGNKTVTIEGSEDSVTTDNKTDCFTKVGFLRKKHIRNLFYQYLNINSLRIKREFLEPLIRNRFEIFLVSEAKLDYCFPRFEFAILGYRLFRKERNQHGGGFNQHIPAKTNNTFNFPNSLKSLLQKSI